MTILPKKKTGKDKGCEPSSHEHHNSNQHSGADSHAVRARHQTNPLRSSAHASNVLATSRVGHVPLQHSVDGDPVVDCHPEFNATLNPVPISGEVNYQPPSQSVVEAAGSSKSAPEAKVNCDRSAHTVAKRRHGRTSPHAALQPYARGKTSRTDGAGECSSAGASHQHPPRRHYPEERTLSAAEIPQNLSPTPRGTRRRTRPKPDGKEEKSVSGHNSDDEHDAARLRRLHQGVDFDELERTFAEALKSARGFYVKEMVQDGACLFRAVADQVYGDQDLHDEVRSNCMDYMLKNADFFSNFITEDFRTYIARKKLAHTHGNHLEMQAMAEMYNRNFEVYQYSTEPINTFQSSNVTDNDPLRVSYHRNSHYNSVVNPYKASVGVGLGLPSFRPGLADQMLLESAQRSSEQELLEQQMLEDKLRAADWETTEDEMVREVAQKSFSEYLRHQEEQARQASASKTSDEVETGPSCSQSSSCSQGIGQQHEAEPSNSKIDPASSKAAANCVPSTSSSSVLFCNPGMGDWVDESEENAILAQVMAQSQREYYVTLTRPDSAAASCSKYPTDQ